MLASAAVAISGRACLPGGVSARGVSAQGYTPPLPPVDRHLWKHNLSATTIADGNKAKRWTEEPLQEVDKERKHRC